MKNYVVIFGGDSVEHDVSILTGLHAARNVSAETKVNLVYITRNNRMVTSGAGGLLSKINSYLGECKAERGVKCFFSCGVLYKRGCLCVRKVCSVDAVINCCHGGAGENGQLAAMLALNNIPVTSCDCVSAALIQSKSRTREVLTKHGFLQPKYTVVTKHQDMSDVLSEIDFPVIVKPDTLGSSIGVSVARNGGELKNALELVFELDNKAVVEQFFENVTEINCSAMLARDKIWTSKCELVNKSDEGEREIFDYNSKYMTNSGFIKKGNEDSDDKEIEDEEKIQEITQKAYELFDARGIIRADFLVVKNGGEVEIYLNEMNSVPGFLSYHLWQKMGLPYGLVIDMMAEQARVDAQKVLKTAFRSEILTKNRSLAE